MTKTLDVICIGRSSVDLYGEQVGGRLEEMASFAKYVGGCPTNISVGTARLGLKSALVTRVGDEHMGRFIREQVARVVAVSDAEIGTAMRLFFTATHNLAEGAGAAALAAALQEAAAPQDRIGVVLTGGNIDADLYGRVLTGAL